MYENNISDGIPQNSSKSVGRWCTGDYSNMVEKLYDQLKPVHNDMEVLNKEVTQLVVEALENQLDGLTEKAKTIGKVRRLNKSCPW